MSEDPHSLFAALLTAGAILSGFCGTFLSFRIQRESNYYRQPALSFQQKAAEDVYIGLTHFTSSLLLLILATLCVVIFGFLMPLLALAGSGWLLARPHLVISGLVATLVLLAGYFLDELVHYKILKTNLVHDAKEWGRETVIVIAAILLAILGALIVFFIFCPAG